MFRTRVRALVSAARATSAALLVLAGGATHAVAQTAAPAAGRPGVAVLDFTNSAIGAAHDELAPLSGGISDLLAGELASNPGIRLVERRQVRALLDEQSLVAGQQVDAQTAIRVGKLLGVQHIIFGGFVTDRSGTMQLHARAVNAETGVIEHVESVSDRTENFMVLVGRLARQLNDGMKLPAPPARSTAEVGAAPARGVPFQSVLLYARAVRAEDSGDRAQAAELYTKSLEQFPGYAPARRALDRMSGGAQR